MWFWKKKEPCFHQWKVSDFFIDVDFMGDSDRYYEISCASCKKQRTIHEYDYRQMEQRGLIKK